LYFDMATNPSRPNILIAGGAGFIGSHLCERFLADGFHVICVDNLLTGRLENVDHLLGTPHFTFLHQDISTSLDVGSDLKYILNFACPASPIDYLKFPMETLAVGSTGMKNLLDLAMKTGARILQASTSEVYGDPLIHPQKEDYWGNVNPIGPRSVYDESKRFAEVLMSSYHREFGLETRIVRIFNTYGPRMRLDDGRVLPTFMRQALSGEPISK
jgi:dTDP-glucose 4,6-dehydratase